jgi:hypothetical protein
VPKHSGTNFLRGWDILRLLPVFARVLFGQKSLPSMRLISHISHGTENILIQYDTGRTEIPFGPFDVCIWVSPFLVQGSPIKGTLTSACSVAFYPEPLNWATTTTKCTTINKASYYRTLGSCTFWAATRSIWLHTMTYRADASDWWYIPLISSSPYCIITGKGGKFAGSVLASTLYGFSILAWNISWAFVLTSSSKRYATGDITSIIS